MRRLATAGLAVIAVASLALAPFPAPPASTTEPYRAFSDTSYWNKMLPVDAPVHPDSAEIIGFLEADNSTNYVLLSGTDSTGRWGQPVYWAGPGDPIYDVTSTRYLLPPEFSSLRIPLGAQPDPTPDAEMTVYDLERGYVAGLYHAEYDAVTDTWTAGGGDIFYLDSNGLHRALPEGDPRNSGNHRGLPPPSYAIRWDEIEAGAINHVLKIGVHHTKDGHVFPMIGDENGSSDPYAPPEGVRVRIKPTVDLTSFGLSPAALTVATALQRYGAVVGDQTGGPVELKMENTIAEGRGHLWNGVVRSDSLAALPLDLYEIIVPGYEPEAGVEWEQPPVIDYSEPRVRVTRPRARVLRTGRRVTILWKTSKTDTVFARVRYKIKGRGFRTIRERTADDGSHVWRAPKRLASKRIRIRVIVRDTLGRRGVGVSRWYRAR